MTRVPGEETRPIHWRMPMGMYEAVSREAQKRKVPLSDIYREALGAWVGAISGPNAGTAMSATTSTFSVGSVRIFES